MQLFGGINPYESTRFGFGYIDTIQKQRSVTASFKGLPVSNQRDQMDDTTRNELRMRKSMEAVRQLMPASGSAQIQVEIPASATSAADLDLSSGGTPGTATTLQSTEEVNASTSPAYSTDPTDWTGSSTAQPTISGEYDGSNGTGTLTFEVSKGGTVGSDNIQIKVYDPNNVQIDNITVHRNDPAGTQYTLSNGLVVSFGDGNIAKNDSFTMEVYGSVDQAVNPDNPFNGTGAADPNFESGLDVTA